MNQYMKMHTNNNSQAEPAPDPSSPQPVAMPKMLSRRLDELSSELGSYGNIATVTHRTKVVEALRLFVERRISALPVVDAEGRVVDIYAKFDVIVSV